MSINSITRPSNIVLNHWRGKHGLLITTVVTLLGLRVLLGYLQDLLPTSPAIVFIGIVILVNVPLLVWQVVGAIRTGDRYLRTTGDMIPVWGGYFAIIITVVLASVQMFSAVIALSPPPQIAEITPLPDLPISADGETITVSGKIDFRLNTALVEALKEHPKIRRVTLMSNGGYIYAARALAYNIMKRHLDTHVEQTCSSACTLAFMAGNARTAGPEARIGFHRYQMEKPDSVQTLNITDELETDREFFTSRGVKDHFVNQVFQAGHSDIWFPSRSELIGGGIITGE